MPVLYYIAALVLAVTLLGSAGRVSDGERALSQLDTPEEKTDTLVKEWMEGLSLGLYSGASEKAAAREQIRTALDAERERVLFSSLGLGLLSAGFLAWMTTSRRRDARAARRLALHLHGVAALCLLVGLAAPMLTVIAQRDVAVLGTVVLQFQSKSL